MVTFLRSKTAVRLAWLLIVIAFVFTYIRFSVPAGAFGLDFDTYWAAIQAMDPILRTVSVGCGVTVAIIQRKALLGLAAVASFFAFFVMAMISLGVCEAWSFIFWDGPTHWDEDFPACRFISF